MNLEAYRVPDAVRSGVDIALPKSDAVFRVRLPSEFNRPYTRAIQTAMFAGATVNPEGKIELGMIDVPAMRDQRIDAFCTHCLIMPLPGGMTVDALREDYFPALDWLFNEAERMAGALDEEGKEVKKKSAAS